MTSPIRRSIQPGGNRKIMESGRQKIWRKKIISLNPPDHRHREIYLSDFLSFSLSLCLSKRNQRNWARKDRFPPCGNGVTNAIYPPCLLLITSICLFFLSNTVGSLGIIIKIIIKSELDCFFFFKPMRADSIAGRISLTSAIQRPIHHIQRDSVGGGGIQQTESERNRQT